MATSLNLAFRWLLIGSALTFATIMSLSFISPLGEWTQFESLAKGLTVLIVVAFFTGLAALLGVGLTEILRDWPAAHTATSRLQVKPTPGVRLPLTFCALGLLLAIYYGLHVFWWNPLTAAPGYQLSEIYSILGQAGEFSLTVILVWGLIVALLLVALPNVHEWLRGMASYSTLRAVGFCSFALSAICFLLSLGWGWHMGMGLADTFMIAGYDSSPTFIPFGIALLALGALGIYGLFAPARTR
ncbi:hypothetical protein [Rothia nasimurium]|uniref:hypothetical protein n=1 Tax=Rothia nasimurium TaxID=85336 RepID=UPI002DD6807C|nr:hypothetical protein [Rothia nasimurium]